jgi:hypothetical protein
MIPDPTPQEVRHNARMATAAAIIAAIVADEATRLAFFPTDALLEVDWNDLRIGRYGQVNEQQIRRHVRAWAATR